MPDLVEQMYCSQQIFIPPNLPSILKKYAKAAIRTQPGDLLAWSSAYFRALAEGIPPPAKDRIEYPPVDTPSGLSPGFLKVLINQIGKRETIHKDVLTERWKGVCLNPAALQDLLDVGMFEDDVSWLEFLAICVGTLEPSLTRTMIELCELLTEEPEGGRAAIPVTIFLNLYKYLAKLDCGPENRLEEYERALKADSETQCQATDLKPTEDEEISQQTNIDWDKALGGVSDGGDVAEEIVVAADTENESGDLGDGNGVQDTITDQKSPEMAESEENSEVKEEEVKTVEVMNDSQPKNASEDVETEKSAVCPDTEGAEIVETDVEVNEVQNDETSPPAAAENEMAEGNEKEQLKDGRVNEADDMEKGESSVEEEEGKTDEVAGGNGGKGDEEIKEETALDSEDTVDKEPDAVKEAEVAASAEAVTADVVQEKETSDETVDVQEGEREEDESKSDDQAPEETEADEDEKADEAVVENGEESNEPDALDDTRDEKVGSEAVPIESTDSPGEGGNEDVEENVGTDDGIEAQPVLEDEQSAPDQQESAEEVNNEASPLADGGVEENDKISTRADSASVTSQDQAEDIAQNGEADDASSNQDETAELAAQGDLADAASADQAPQDPAEDGAPKEEADDPSSNQGETEEPATQGDGANAASAGDASQDQADDSTQNEADDPSLNEAETVELDAQADDANAASADIAPPDQVEDVPQNEADDPSLNEAETVELDAQGDEANAASADIASPDQVEDVPQNEADEPSSIQTDSEQPADEVEDQAGSTGAVDDQDAASQSKDETGEDENVLENTDSAVKIPKEIATAETSAAENLEQKAEDENGNENQLLSVEEIIDPKSAYIVNDDGTLSAPRPESVVDEDALKERDSDTSVYTKESEGMMVWPDIKPQDKEEAEPEPLLDKEVTSEDGIEVFTDVEVQAHQEELKLLPEQQEEEPDEAEQEENIFAPQIDSFTELLEAESSHVEEANPEQLAAALESMELALEEQGVTTTSGVIALELPESDEQVSQGQAETATVLLAESKVEEGDQAKDKKLRRQRKDVEIESLVKKDSDMMLLPTPITSDVMLYVDGPCDKAGVKSQTQQLSHKMSMIDVQVSVPVDETVVEVVEQHRYPKWMHIPGIGPTVPDHIVEEAEKYFLKIAELQEGMVMPRNIKHFHCPLLELLPDCPEGIAEGV